MQLPYSDQLDIQYLGHLFDNTSECYKLFWFQAIMTKIDAKKETFTFDELVNEMIADAWYMVTEYHLNLGPKDNLEAVVLYISKITGFKNSEKKETILEYLHTCTDKEVLRIKRKLIANVPYRLQAPFMPDFKGTAWNVGERKLSESINQQKRLMYYFLSYQGLDTVIRMETEWVLYFQKNKEIIKGWIQYHMIKYLQKRNPSVPGISNKLYPPRERNLTKVIKYWRMLMEIQPVHEIYNDQKLSVNDISIDHFVPWSYVAHDEMWNLSPTTKSINSKKSNNLPDWEYFSALAQMEYLSYQMIWQYDSLHDEFKKCAKEHLNTDLAYKLYYMKDQSETEFGGRLEEIVLPVYESAKNSGFSNWIYEK